MWGNVTASDLVPPVVFDQSRLYANFLGYDLGIDLENGDDLTAAVQVIVDEFLDRNEWHGGEMPGARDRLERMVRDAVLQGTRGLAADILSYTARPWGFDASAVKAKTLIVNGQADVLAGNAHATWYQRTVPDSRVEMIPKRGHLVIIPAWDRVLSHLAPNTKLRS